MVVAKAVVADLAEEAEHGMGVLGDGRERDNGANAVLEAGDFVFAVLDDSGVGAKETARDLDTIGDDGGEIEERTVRVWCRGFGGKEELAFVRVAQHANRVAKLVVSFQEAVLDEVLLVPGGVVMGGEEARHVVGEGSDDGGGELSN